MKYVFQSIAAFILIIIGNLILNKDLGLHLIAEGIIIITIMSIAEISFEIYKNRKRFWLLIGCKYHAIKNDSIRFSMSYQYRIKIKDKYLLVKNSNWDFYQHVGGKYKRFPLTQYILNKFEARDDLRMETTGLKKDDLAIFIPAKNALNFIDWFNTYKEREISHWREFYEELIDGKAQVLDKNAFPYINYNYVDTLITPIKKAHNWECWEILHYDVLDIIPTIEQEKELEKLLEKGDTDYIKWADEELIQNLGYDKRSRTTLYNIGVHTKWVLNLKWSRD